MLSNHPKQILDDKFIFPIIFSFTLVIIGIIIGIATSINPNLGYTSLSITIMMAGFAFFVSFVSFYNMEQNADRMDDIKARLIRIEDKLKQQFPDPIDKE
jgi:hypothetical protein